MQDRVMAVSIWRIRVASLSGVGERGWRGWERGCGRGGVIGRGMVVVVVERNWARVGVWEDGGGSVVYVAG